MGSSVENLQIAYSIKMKVFITFLYIATIIKSIDCNPIEVIKNDLNKTISTDGTSKLTLTTTASTTTTTTASTSGCCHQIKLELKNEPKETLERFEGLYNMVGYVNGQKYWLSTDKKWAIYVSMKKIWIIGSVEALGTPKDINAWMYAPVSPCPENFNGNSSIHFWDDELPDPEFVQIEKEDSIQIQCASQNEKQTQKYDHWFETMSKETVDTLIKSSSDAELCGRRPWTNVENHQKMYPEGHVQGFSGLPFGPDIHPVSPNGRRKKRIVNGGASNYGEWPWQIRMLDSKDYSGFCGGSVINKEWVITAAHCVEDLDTASDIRVIMGEHNTETTMEPYNQVDRMVSRIKLHPFYNAKIDQKWTEFDLALVKFDRPIEYTPNIIPICLPELDHDFGGQNAWVTGWGDTDPDSESEDDFPSRLREVNVPLKTTEECGDDFNEDLTEEYDTYETDLNDEEIHLTKLRATHRIRNYFICSETHEDSRDSCQGDSGGPLVVQRADGRFVLAGLTSWGEGCGTNYGYYTKVSKFIDWIKHEISPL